MRSSGHSSLLGIALEHERMTAVALHRSNGKVQVRQTLQTALSLDPVTNDPELVGREIRNHLSKAGIHENRCVVCVPLNWALTMRTELPDLSEEDTSSYLHLQAERGFPFAPEDLSISVSRYRMPDGVGGATIVGIPLTRLDALLRGLRAAKLRPISITLGVTSLLKRETTSQSGVVTLLVGEDGIDLAVSTGGGVTALRSLNASVTADPEGTAVDADTIARELRITLGQLPRDQRDTIRTVQVFGPTHLAAPLSAALQNGTGADEIPVEMGGVMPEVYSAEARTLEQLPPGAVGPAANRLLGRPAALEFLIPQSSRLRQLTGRMSSRAALWLGGAAAAVVLVAASALFVQHWRLSRLERQWKVIEPRFLEVAAIQENVRRFRPWFDDSAQSLRIIRSLTEAFPEDGDVWARTLEIKVPPDFGRGASEASRPAGLVVKCTGRARSTQQWLDVLQQLGKTKGVTNLHAGPLTGKDPLQFEVSFGWNAGEADGR